MPGPTSPDNGNGRYATEPPAGLSVGVEQFNGGEYFEAHETLEELWLEEAGEVRRLYQGILQVGVAFHHWRNGNFRGADSLLERGIAYLQPFRPECMSIDIERLIADAAACHAELRRLGPRRMSQYDPARFARIHRVEKKAAY